MLVTVAVDGVGPGGGGGGGGGGVVVGAGAGWTLGAMGPPAGKKTFGGGMSDRLVGCMAARASSCSTIVLGAMMGERGLKKARRLSLIFDFFEGKFPRNCGAGSFFGREEKRIALGC